MLVWREFEEGRAPSDFGTADAGRFRQTAQAQPTRGEAVHRQLEVSLPTNVSCQCWRACEGNLEAHGQNRFTWASKQG